LLSSNVKCTKLHSARVKFVFVVVVVVVVIRVGRVLLTNLHFTDDEYYAEAQVCSTTTGKRALSQSTLQQPDTT
jgi:hypothetical protein